MKCKSRKSMKMSIAAAVALAFIAIPETSVLANSHIVKCYGVNGCKGKSACQITTNSCKMLNNCKGQNACKGQGFLYKTFDNCKDLGGTTPQEPPYSENNIEK